MKYEGSYILTIVVEGLPLLMPLVRKQSRIPRNNIIHQISKSWIFHQ